MGRGSGTVQTPPKRGELCRALAGTPGTGATLPSQGHPWWSVQRSQAPGLGTSLWSETWSLTRAPLPRCTTISASPLGGPELFTLSALPRGSQEVRMKENSLRITIQAIFTDPHNIQ